MVDLNYSKRIAIVTQEVQKLLNGYEPPRSRAEDAAWQKQEISDVAEAVNSSIPKSMDQDSIYKLFDRMRRDLKKSAKTRAWPIAREIVDVIKERTPREQFQASQVKAFDSDTINAKRMNAGEAVAETYVKGSGSNRLLEKNLVTMNVMQMYREGLEKSLIETYSMPECGPVEHVDHLEENPY